MHDLRLNAVLNKRIATTSYPGYPIFAPHTHSIDKLPP
jgi:hypothetical protein